MEKSKVIQIYKTQTESFSTWLMIFIPDKKKWINEKWKKKELMKESKLVQKRVFHISDWNYWRSYFSYMNTEDPLIVFVFWGLTMPFKDGWPCLALARKTNLARLFPHRIYLFLIVVQLLDNVLTRSVSVKKFFYDKRR